MKLLKILMSAAIISIPLLGNSLCEGKLPDKGSLTNQVDILTFKMSQTILDVKRNFEVRVDDLNFNENQLKVMDNNDAFYYILSSMHQGLFAPLSIYHANKSIGGIINKVVDTPPITMNYHTNGDILHIQQVIPLDGAVCSMLEDKGTQEKYASNDAEYILNIYIPYSEDNKLGTSTEVIYKATWEVKGEYYTYIESSDPIESI